MALKIDHATKQSHVAVHVPFQRQAFSNSSSIPLGSETAIMLKLGSTLVNANLLVQVYAIEPHIKHSLILLEYADHGGSCLFPRFLTFKI